MDAANRSVGPVIAADITAYRPFIDGLRAVSILLVVLYHVGIPGTSGGYVGVDVFFVISGFLIISQIVAGLGRGTFSFSEFWARRALRILPPYLLVLAVTAALTPFVLVMPDEFRAFSREVRDAALMVVNHLYLSQQGYFDTGSDTKVLLHLWSLAVEEQFYLVVPCLTVLLWQLPVWLQRPELRSRLLFWAAVAMFGGSLAGCVLLTSGGRNYAFYLTVLRAWEFIAGGAIGFLVPFAGRLPRRLHGWLAAAGLAAIIVAAASFRSDTLYPSWRAVVPVFGAAAVIFAGIAEPKSPVIRLLAAPPMVWIGLVSYAWYLWHWPLLALSRIHNFGERDLASDLLVGLISLGLAAATHHLVERPIRRWYRMRTKRLGWRPVLAGMLMAIATAIGGFQAFQALARNDAGEIDPAFVPKSAKHSVFCDLIAQSAGDCLAMSAGRPLGLLIGDLLMLASRNVLAGHAEASGSLAVSVAAPGCVALFGVRIFTEDPEMASDCVRRKDNALPQLRAGAIKPEYAILYSRWPAYAAGPATISLGLDEADAPAADGDELFITALRRTVAELKSFGVRRILVLNPSPFFPRSVPNCLSLADRSGIDKAKACAVDRTTAETERHKAVLRIAEALDGVADVRIVDPFDAFCDAVRCLPFADDRIFFVDTNHPSDAGMEQIIAVHRAEFDWAVGGKSR